MRKYIRADDVVLSSKKLENLNKKEMKAGLTINLQKTKILPRERWKSVIKIDKDEHISLLRQFKNYT